MSIWNKSLPNPFAGKKTKGKKKTSSKKKSGKRRATSSKLLKNMAMN